MRKINILVPDFVFEMGFAKCGANILIIEKPIINILGPYFGECGEINILGPKNPPNYGTNISKIVWKRQNSVNYVTNVSFPHNF